MPLLVSSELDLDRTLGCVDASPDYLVPLPRDLSVAEVADLALLERAHARVADALAAAVGQVEPRLLAGHEDRRRPVGLGFRVALEELDRAALALLGAADLRLEALHVEAVAVAVLVPVLLHRVEHPARAREERLALLPV